MQYRLGGVDALDCNPIILQETGTNYCPSWRSVWACCSQQNSLPHLSSGARNVYPTNVTTAVPPSFEFMRSYDIVR